MATRHMRRHWKKYALGLFTWLGSKWAANRHRENVIMRRYCYEAMKYNDEKINHITDLSKKVYVFLNPTANNRKARKQFQKYCYPLLNLWGVDIVVIESDYEGQLGTLINYIEPSTAAIIVAGGGGTLLEVINGFLKRCDKEGIDIPVGVLPLGKDNEFFMDCLNSISEDNLPARKIGEATMNVIRGSLSSHHVMKIQPEKGQVLYALRSIKWGVFDDIITNKDSFRLFGRFRLLMSSLNTVVRRWPMDFTLNISSSLSSDPLSTTPISFILSLDKLSNESLSLSLYSSETITKSQVINTGLMECIKVKDKGFSSLPSSVISSPHMSLTPKSSNNIEWFSVDGEPYEAVPLNISLQSNCLKIFTPHQCPISN